MCDGTLGDDRQELQESVEEMRLCCAEMEGARLRTVVCLKHVAAVRPQIREGAKEIVEVGLAYEVNEADLYALEEALAQRAIHGGTVTGVTVGAERAREALNTAIAAGIDDAVHIFVDDVRPVAAEVAAAALAAQLPELGYDLVLTGVQASDDLLGLTGALLAEHLHIPCVTGVVGLEIDAAGGMVRATRELASGFKQEIELHLPCLLTVQLGIRPLKYVPIIALLRARRRQVRSVPISSLTGDETALRVAGPRVLQFFSPIEQSTCEMLPGAPSEAAANLARKLFAEGILGVR